MAEATSIDKSAIKATIKELKAKRQEALDAKDAKALKAVRRQIRALKQKTRRASK